MTPVLRTAGLVVLALSLCPACAARGHAQALPPLDAFHVRAFGPTSGLLYADVRGLAQGADGYIYVATGRGLTRFDGHRFRPVPLPGARAKAISAMHADRSGRFWIAGSSYDVMGYYEAGRFQPLPLPPGSIAGLASISDRGVWFSGANGLLHLSPGESPRFSRYTVADGLPNDTLSGVFELADGRDVAVTTTRLAFVDADTSTRGLRLTPFGPEYRLEGGIRVDANGLWLTCRTERGSLYVLRYHGDRFARYDAPAGAPFLPFEWFDWSDAPAAASIRGSSWPVRFRGERNSFIRRALRARDGTIWLAASDDGEGRDDLLRYAQGRVDTIPLRAHGDFQSISHLLEDHEGSLWIGTDRALFQLSPRRIAALERRHGLAEEFTVPLVQTRDGALWVGTWGGGLHRFAEGRLTHRYTTRNGLPDDKVRALHEAADGTLWVGMSLGLAAVREGRVVVSEKSDHVRAFAETLDGLTTTLWIGTENRLLARTSRGTRSHRPEHWSRRQIWALHTARDGSLWIGSEGGLFRLVNDSLHPFGSEDGLRGTFVASISEEADGTMWFGTYENGLHRYRGKRFVALTTEEGLLHDGVWRMLPDDRGGVWMSSDAGVFRVDHARLHDVADAVERGERPSAPLSPIVFTEAEGMPSRESNRASPGGWRLDDGRLVFNNVAGVIVIDPARAAHSSVPSPSVILDLTADGQSVPLDGPEIPRIPPGSKQLAFDFATLSYTAPEQNRYRYRLQGYDEDWIQGGSERRAHYTNLPPGRYAFHVQGASAVSGWGEAAAVPFTLAPFVWQRRWFQLLTVAALLGLSVAAYRYRVGRLMEMERLRMRIASDLHDDVGSNLSSIALLSEMLQGDTRLGGLERRQLERINHAAGETISALHDIIWLVGPKHDDLVELVGRMQGVAADMLNGTAYRFEVGPVEPRRPGMTFMRNVLLIYKEALHNVRKHAGAREVAIAITNDDGEFVLRIEDDGTGFDEARIRPGHGLENMRRRAEQSGGRLEIVRSATGGTSITFSARMAESRDGRIASRGAP